MQRFQNPIIVILLLLVVITITNSWEVFNLRPASVHQWRQSDCAAYTKTFFRNNTGLFTPGTFNLAGKEGRVASEFPIIYYTAAKVQRIVGEHYGVVRGLTFLCYVLGLIALLGIIRKWISPRFYAVFSVVILATTPFYYYYALNFLPNVPAISFSFIGLYCLLRYEEKNRLAYLISGVLAFTLATLFKPTDGGILLVAYVGVKLYDCLFSKRRIPFSRSMIYLLLGVIFIALINVGWVGYVNNYNDLNGNHQNLIGIYPVWEMDSGLRNYTAKRIVKEWSSVFQQKLLLALLGGFLLIYVMRWKRLERFLKLFTLFTFLGTLGYSILWFKAYNDHDYYQLPLVLPAVFLSVTVLEYYVRCWRPKLQPVAKGGIFIVLLIAMAVSVYHNRGIQYKRYYSNEENVVNPRLFEIEPYLLELGIGPDDHIVSVPDRSPNTSLNAMNRYGYTEEFNDENYNIRAFQQQGAHYLVISDSSYLSHPLYLPYLNKRVGSFKGVYIFDIRE